VIQSSETAKNIRAYVSQPSDRQNGGGYRPTQDALAAARQELVNEALNVLTSTRTRFTHLPELDPLFARVDEVVLRWRAESLPRAAV